MQIALIDADNLYRVPNFPNLPLMKLSAWHKARGDDVEWWMPFKHYDIAYVSKVFDFTPEITTPIDAHMVIYGGTGSGSSNTLPPDIEGGIYYPDYSLYPQFTAAYGFLTRGCPRRCPFCVISTKEGAKSVKVADINYFWRKQKEIKLLDPNLLACKDAPELLKQLADSGAYIDFTQGLDIRLMTDEYIELLKRCKIKRIHFAWDNPNEDLTGDFKRFMNAYPAHYSKLCVYVLANYWSTLEQDLYRIYTLRDMGFNPYVMTYDKQNAPPEIKRLQRWVNNRRIFRSVARFEDYKA